MDTCIFDCGLLKQQQQQLCLSSEQWQQQWVLTTAPSEHVFKSYSAFHNQAQYQYQPLLGIEIGIIGLFTTSPWTARLAHRIVQCCFYWCYNINQVNPFPFLH